MDSSTYIPDQQPMLVFSGNSSLENQPVTFGPELFETLSAVSPLVGGAKFMLGGQLKVTSPAPLSLPLPGLSLRDPNSSNIPLLAAASERGLGSMLDSLIIGNVRHLPVILYGCLLGTRNRTCTHLMAFALTSRITL